VAPAVPASGTALATATASALPETRPADIDTAPPLEEAAAEVIAQLEAEVEYKRQQVAAQMVELRDRELRLNTVTAELDAARGELGGLRNEIETLRTTVARLERAAVEKNKAFEAQDAHTAALQEELERRLAAQRADPPRGRVTDVTRTGQLTDAGIERAPAPALICLTGDADEHFTLTRKNTVIGRGSHCDLQILTHFVSREHARVTLNGGAVLIEDLGSRNGVFVNSVRIDRHVLEHGDLVTIGETQFRFVESVAH
jgi:hypothetical protein